MISEPLFSVAVMIMMICPQWRHCDYMSIIFWASFLFSFVLSFAFSQFPCLGLYLNFHLQTKRPFTNFLYRLVLLIRADDPEALCRLWRLAVHNSKAKLFPESWAWKWWVVDKQALVQCSSDDNDDLPSMTSLWLHVDYFLSYFVNSSFSFVLLLHFLSFLVWDCISIFIWTVEWDLYFVFKLNVFLRI